MKHEKFYLRFLISVAVLGGLLSVLFWFIADPGDSSLEPDMIFLDLLPVSVCTALALYFRSRFLTACSVCLAVFYLLVKTGVIILYCESFLPLTFDTLTLLWEHTDHQGIKAMIGEYYFIWAPVCGLLLLTGTVYAAGSAVRASGTFPNQTRDKILIGVLVYTLLSLTANARYIWYRDVNTAVEENYVGHVITPLTRVFGEIIRDGIVSLRPDLNQDRYGFEPKQFSGFSRDFLTDTGLLAEQNTEPCLLPEFDRILIVAVESLDGDFLNSSGNPKLPEGLTPELDALKQQYFSFSSCYSAAQPTSWGLNALILSRPDYKLDKTMRNVSLCDIFRSKGIQSIYLSPVDGEFGDNRKYFRKMYRFDKMLFDEEIFRDYPYAETSGGWGLSDETMYKVALDYLRTHRPDRYFMLVSTMDTHYPYHVSGKQGKDFGNDFFNAIHSADKNIGSFVRDFVSDPVLFNDRTLLIITADHSASHGENYTARKILTDPAKIPLIFITKQPLAGLDRDRLFSTIDLPAAFVRMTGEKIPDTFMGQDFTRKKDFALTRDVTEQIRLFLPEGKQVSFSKLHPEPHTAEERALLNYYTRYYLLKKSTDRDIIQ